PREGHAMASRARVAWTHAQLGRPAAGDAGWPPDRRRRSGCERLVVCHRTWAQRRAAGRPDRRDHCKPRDDRNIRDRDCFSRPGALYFLTVFSSVASCFVLVLSATRRSTATAVHPVSVWAVGSRLTSGRAGCGSFARAAAAGISPHSMIGWSALKLSPARRASAAWRRRLHKSR